MNEMMELMHQLLLGNGILIAGCVYVCAELLKSFLPRMNSTWIPLIGAIKMCIRDSSEDVAAWQNELDRIAEATAAGLAKAMRIPSGS